MSSWQAGGPKPGFYKGSRLGPVRRSVDSHLLSITSESPGASWFEKTSSELPFERLHGIRMYTHARVSTASHVWHKEREEVMGGRVGFCFSRGVLFLWGPFYWLRGRCRGVFFLLLLRGGGVVFLAVLLFLLFLPGERFCFTVAARKNVCFFVAVAVGWGGVFRGVRRKGVGLQVFKTCGVEV